MKLRPEKRKPGDTEELQLLAEVRELARQSGDPLSTEPPEAYWQNLPVRVNRRIDEATSGVALSISWAARVAIPGVLAVLSFLIGLQYYVPRHQGGESLDGIVAALPVIELDSLVVTVRGNDEMIVAEDLTRTYTAMTGEQAAEYLLGNGQMATLLESLPDDQLQGVFSRVGVSDDIRSLPQ